jgi:hypothetical protein
MPPDSTGLSTLGISLLIIRIWLYSRDCGMGQPNDSSPCPGMSERPLKTGRFAFQGVARASSRANPSCAGWAWALSGDPHARREGRFARMEFFLTPAEAFKAASLEDGEFR